MEVSKVMTSKYVIIQVQLLTPGDVLSLHPSKASNLKTVRGAFMWSLFLTEHLHLRVYITSFVLGMDTKKRR